MHNKKLGFLILGIVLTAVVYYFMSNNISTTKALEQNTKLKQQVNMQLTQMQSSGFSILDREIQQEEEHFVISLDDPQKATVFFAQKGLRIDIEEAEELKGLKVRVDVSYFNNAISLDLYPVTLPINLKTILATEENKDLSAQIDEMLKQKVFFMHMDVDHSATTFTGNVKDISETIKDEKEIQLTLQGYEFSGELKGERVTKFKQTLNESHLQMGDEMDRYISGLESSYELTGATTYDYISDYSIEEIKINEAPMAVLHANNISLHSTSNVKNGLAEEKFNIKMNNIDILTEEEKIGMKTLLLDMNMSNIDVAALEKLQKTDSKNIKESDALIETIVSKNIHMDISMLSVEQMILHGKEIPGFTLHSKMDIDPSLDIYQLGINPKHARNKMNGDIHLSLSKELLNVIKEDPKAMLTYMMYRPKRKLGQRIYDIRIGNGKIKVNGKTVDF